MLYHIQNINGDVLELDVPENRSIEHALFDYDPARYPRGFTRIVCLPSTEDEPPHALVMVEPNYDVVFLGVQPAGASARDAAHFEIKNTDGIDGPLRFRLSYNTLLDKPNWHVLPSHRLTFYYEEDGSSHGPKWTLQHLYHFTPSGAIEPYSLSDDTVDTVMRIAHEQLGVPLTDA